MRIHLISDLHLEFQPYTLPRSIKADVCVIAGDACTPTHLPRLRHTLRGWRMPTVLVHGNHCLWHDVVGLGMVPSSQLRDAVSDLSGEFHVLDCEHVDIAGVRFFGGAMWTDFRIYGTPDESKRVAQRCMRDFQYVGVNDGGKMRHLTPDDMVAGLARFRAAFAQSVADAPGDVVCVSHFLPSARCIDQRFAMSDVNPYFASAQDDLFGGKVKLWCLGHTHACMDFEHRDTRIVCNPRGYPGENPAFDARKVIEV